MGAGCRGEEIQGNGGGMGAGCRGEEIHANGGGMGVGCSSTFAAPSPCLE